MRRRPPNGSRTLRTRGGRRACASVGARRERACPSLSSRLTSRPIGSAQSIRRRLTPVAASNCASTAACTFSYTRGTLGRSVGRTCGRASATRSGIGEEGDREPDVCAEEQHQPPVVVREREVQEHDVVGAVVRLLHPVDDRCHLVVVAMAEHAALRRAGRAGRVDDREEVVLADRRGRLVERARVRGREVPAVGGEPVEVVVREDVLQRRAAPRRPPRPWRAGSRPRRRSPQPRSARAGSRRRARSSRRTRERRPRRSARARSRRAPSRGCSARGGRRCRLSALPGRGSRSRTRGRARRPPPTTPRASRLVRSRRGTPAPAGPAATASRHRRAIVRAVARSGSPAWLARSASPSELRREGFDASSENLAGPT